MAIGNSGSSQTAKERLESGFKVLETLLLYRVLTGSPNLGWGIERSIVDRELQDLEGDSWLKPTHPARSSATPHKSVHSNPSPLPFLPPALRKRLKPDTER